MPFFVILALNPALSCLTNPLTDMHPNPVSSLAPAGGTIDCDLQRKIAALDAIADDLPVVKATYFREYRPNPPQHKGLTECPIQLRH